MPFGQYPRHSQPRRRAPHDPRPPPNKGAGHVGPDLSGSGPVGFRGPRESLPVGVWHPSVELCEPARFHDMNDSSNWLRNRLLLALQPQSDDYAGA